MIRAGKRRDEKSHKVRGTRTYTQEETAGAASAGFGSCLDLSQTRVELLQLLDLMQIRADGNGCRHVWGIFAVKLGVVNAQVYPNECEVG
jgi:hypothetical protein